MSNNTDLRSRNNREDEPQPGAPSQPDPQNFQFITFTDLRDTTSRQTKKRVRQHVMQGIRRNAKSETAMRKMKEGEILLDISPLLESGDTTTNTGASNSRNSLDYDGPVQPTATSSQTVAPSAEPGYRNIFHGTIPSSTDSINSELSKSYVQRNASAQGPQTQDASAEEGLDVALETVMEAVGRLDLDDQGNWNYQGPGSTSAFVRRITERLSNVSSSKPASSPLPNYSLRPQLSQYPSIAYSQDTTTQYHARISVPLPSIEIACDIVSRSLDDGCALYKFIHQPTFYRMFNRMYNIHSSQYQKDEIIFLPLLYAAIAVGYLYSDSELAHLGCAYAVSQGRKYFNACKELLDLTECRHIWSLQALVFMIIYSQSSAKLATCHSYVSAAVAASIQIGLHRCDAAGLSLIEKETRRRLFWTIRTMETYIVSIMGLPMTLSENDIDQQMPAEIDDDDITDQANLYLPGEQMSIMTAVNAHTRLIFILAKIINQVYPTRRVIKQTNNKSKGYLVSDSKIRETEADLASWVRRLPETLKPGSKSASGLTRFRITKLLTLAYTHVQMFLYRPFLHYISHSNIQSNFSREAYAYAAECVDTSRRVIQNIQAMKEGNILNGPYWFCSYTTFCATVSLIFHVWENVEVEGALFTLRDAEYGREILRSLASKSLAANKNSEILAAIFARLPERLSKTQEQNPGSGSRSYVSDKAQSEIITTASGSEFVDSPSTYLRHTNTQDNEQRGNHQKKSSSAPCSEGGPLDLNSVSVDKYQYPFQQLDESLFSTLNPAQVSSLPQELATEDVTFPYLDFSQDLFNEGNQFAHALDLELGQHLASRDELTQNMVGSSTRSTGSSGGSQFQSYIPLHPYLLQPSQPDTHSCPTNGSQGLQFSLHSGSDSLRYDEEYARIDGSNSGTFG